MSDFSYFEALGRFEKLDIINWFEGLANGTIQPRDKSAGICYNFEFRFGRDVPNTLYPFFKEWPSYSGDIKYPVPRFIFFPRIGYDSATNKWKGFYGRRRRKLCAFIAKRMRDFL